MLGTIPPFMGGVGAEGIECVGRIDLHSGLHGCSSSRGRVPIAGGDRRKLLTMIDLDSTFYHEKVVPRRLVGSLTGLVYEVQRARVGIGVGLGLWAGILPPNFPRSFLPTTGLTGGDLAA